MEIRAVDPFASAMPSLIVATLSLDDMRWLRQTMRPPLTWVTVWNVRAHENLT
jgi:hypothetical protein